MAINVYAAWIAFLLGGLAGAASGLFFHNEQWLGGYGSWPRRMIRLGHIAFFGLGLLNLSAAPTARALGITSGRRCERLPDGSRLATTRNRLGGG